MNFFKSILADDSDSDSDSDLESPKSEDLHQSTADTPTGAPIEDRDAADVRQDVSANVWNFGGLIKTLAARSESVIEVYRKDLQEFGSGLKKETDIIREAASRAVKDLPISLEAGASAAHGVLDGVLKSTAEIISKEAQFFGSDGEPGTPGTNRSLNSGRYSWFEAQQTAIQSDLNTFCEEPDDVEEYKKWKSKFQLEEKRDEIDDLIGESGILDATYKKVVPNVVDHETFWCRYFYRVDKLKLQERIRVNLVKRAMSGDDDDDELSWDVEEEEEKDGYGVELASVMKMKGTDGAGQSGVSDGSLNSVEKGKGSSVKLQEENVSGSPQVDDEAKNNTALTSDKTSSNVLHDGGDGIKLDEANKKTSGDIPQDEKEKSDEVIVVKTDARTPNEEIIEGKNDGNLGEAKGDDKVLYEGGIKEKKNEDVGIVKVESGGQGQSSNQEKEKEKEEDLGWDEIEDDGSDDEKRNSTASQAGRPDRAHLKKQLSATEDEEELSWDIEDDDEPVKS